jgi:glutathione S-transferase
MKLYGYRNGRTLRALWALEEVAASYEYLEVDLLKGEAREASFLKINPAGKVPVLIDGEHVITESAAICLHLGEKYPDSGLLPPSQTTERTECYKWISFILTELDAALWTIAKHRFALPEEKRVEAVLDTAAWEYGTAVKILAAQVSQQTYLAGASFSVADILGGHVLLWARSARLDVRSPALERYLHNLESREPLRRAQARTKQPASAAEP